MQPKMRKTKSGFANLSNCNAPITTHFNLIATVITDLVKLCRHSFCPLILNFGGLFVYFDGIFVILKHYIPSHKPAMYSYFHIKKIDQDIVNKIHFCVPQKKSSQTVKT